MKTNEYGNYNLNNLNCASNALQNTLFQEEKNTNHQIKTKSNFCFFLFVNHSKNNNDSVSYKKTKVQKKEVLGHYLIGLGCHL